MVFRACKCIWENPAGLFHDCVELGVGAVGSVVEEVQPVDVRLPGEQGGVLPSAVAPAAMLLVLFGRVVGVDQQEVGFAHSFEQAGVDCCVAGLVVGGVDECAAGAADAVAGGSLGVLERDGEDFRVAHEERFGELDVADLGGHARVGDGKEGRGHLRGERGVQALDGGGGVDGDVGGGVVKGGKVGQALQVVPVKVAEEEVDVCAGGQAKPELTDAGAGVQDEEVVARADFNAGRVAAVAEAVAGGRGDGAADAAAAYGEGRCGLMRCVAHDFFSEVYCRLRTWSLLQR